MEPLNKAQKFRFENHENYKSKFALEAENYKKEFWLKRKPRKTVDDIEASIDQVLITKN